MPATGKSSGRTPRATADTRKRYEQNGRALDRVTKSLESAQGELSALRGSMGSGASDLRKDLSRLLRDARREAGKLSNTIRRDLERIQKDLASTAAKSSPRARRGAHPNSKARSSTTRRSRGTSASK
jgi:energy-coupling factor transporter ATP-binding protein EcfA2